MAYVKSGALPGLGGLGCDECHGKCGMGDLNPMTWGPSDWLVAIGLGFAGWKMFASDKQERYTRRVMRRLGAE